MTQEMIPPSLQAIARLLETVHQLRAPGGCPWDRAQTHQSLRPYLIEEAYEVLDVLDQIENPEKLKNEKIKNAFLEELGDLLMQVLLHAELTHEQNAFNFQDIAQFLNEKLIRRHPHVFGEIKADSAEKAFQNWEKEKAKEKSKQPLSSILDGLPRSLPALQKATRVIEKVTRVGFQWSDLQGPLAKLEEELNELKDEIKKHQDAQQNCNRQADQESQSLKAIESELGDVLFSLCNLAYLLKLNPENSLRNTLAKFESRFRFVEKSLKSIGKAPDQSNLQEMDRYWEMAKKVERTQVWGLTGGIGSGKSTVARIISSFGIPVIDADQIAKNLRENETTVQQALLARFGTTQPKELKKIIFQDSQARKDLEQLLHPLIQEECKKQIEKLAQNSSVIIYEASLIIESGQSHQCTGLIVVGAPLEDRIERIKKRDQLDESTIHKIIQSQISDEEYSKHADIMIDNSGTLEDLQSQLQGILRQKGWITS